jgi:hypothetical protein
MARLLSLTNTHDRYAHGTCGVSHDRLARKALKRGFGIGRNVRRMTSSSGLSHRPWVTMNHVL